LGAGDIELLRSVTALSRRSLPENTGDGDSANLTGRLRLGESAHLEEQIRQAVGGSWVEQIDVEGSLPSATVARAIDASRHAGRPVRIIGAHPLQLPNPMPNERWLRRERKSEVTWILSRRGQSRQQLIQRTLDLILTLPLIVLLSPVFVAIAATVRFSSPGPILYRWRVLGRNGKPFTGYKFRTMLNNADSTKAGLLAQNEMVGPVFKLTNDPRVTPVGRWLRRYSLDELPQLVNVVRGQMSLVGPRPVFRDEYRRFELWQMRKLSVMPGMTCLWQVKGRNAIKDFGDWARLDLEYIDTWSLALDLKILAQSVQTVIRGTGV